MLLYRCNYLDPSKAQKEYSFYAELTTMGSHCKYRAMGSTIQLLLIQSLHRTHDLYLPGLTHINLNAVTSSVCYWRDHSSWEGLCHLSCKNFNNS